MNSKKLIRCVAAAILSISAATVSAQRYMEKLNRGVVAVNQGDGKSFVSWRMLGTDPDAIAFNVYRTIGSGAPQKLNAVPITNSTNFVDSGVNFEQAVSYFVRPVLNGGEQALSDPFKFPAGAAALPYISIPLKPGTGVPNDASAADLDGDGQYEIILKRENGYI
jgi:rhamnogalacturonan endolyase